MFKFSKRIRVGRGSKKSLSFLHSSKGTSLFRKLSPNLQKRVSLFDQRGSRVQQYGAVFPKL